MSRVDPSAPPACRRDRASPTSVESNGLEGALAMTEHRRPRPAASRGLPRELRRSCGRRRAVVRRGALAGQTERRGSTAPTEARDASPCAPRPGRADTEESRARPTCRTRKKVGLSERNRRGEGGEGVEGVEGGTEGRKGGVGRARWGDGVGRRVQSSAAARVQARCSRASRVPMETRSSCIETRSACSHDASRVPMSSPPLPPLPLPPPFEFP